MMEILLVVVWTALFFWSGFGTALLAVYLARVEVRDLLAAVVYAEQHPRPVHDGRPIPPPPPRPPAGWIRKESRLERWQRRLTLVARF